MESDTIKPKWLTNEVVEEMKKFIRKYPNPYTQQEVNDLELDGEIDFKRLRAYRALKVLGKYGLLED